MKFCPFCGTADAALVHGIWRRPNRDQDMSRLRKGDIDNTRFLSVVRIPQKPAVLLNKGSRKAPQIFYFFI